MRRRCLMFAMIAGVTVIFCSVSWSKEKREKVRVELAGLQEARGLTIGSVDFSGIDTVQFAKRSWTSLDLPVAFKKVEHGTLSPDGEELAFALHENSSYNSPSWLGIVQRDGSGLREYPELQRPYGICWSQDKSKLVFTALQQGQPNTYELVLLDMDTGRTRQIESKAFVETQCFSPDGQQFVYETDHVIDKHGAHGRIKVHDLTLKTSRELISGVHPTWSPSGKTIAYFDHNAYFLISPSGAGRKRLFKNRYAYSPLWWSPDSRFVAYGVYCCFWKSIKYMVDIGHLQVRRLEDNAEDWVGETNPPTGTYGWIELSPRKRD
ncbi:MAG: hypothetical protein LAO78_21980 [Acidobacteriia bacterium]|nr:hypothetical protein [Terriglobia bacterium]